MASFSPDMTPDILADVVLDMISKTAGMKNEDGEPFKVMIPRDMYFHLLEGDSNKCRDVISQVGIYDQEPLQ